MHVECMTHMHLTTHHLAENAAMYYVMGEYVLTCLSEFVGNPGPLYDGHTCLLRLYTYQRMPMYTQQDGRSKE